MPDLKTICITGGCIFFYIVVVVRYGGFIFGNNKIELFYNIWLTTWL